MRLVSKATSRVFDVWDRLYDLMLEQQWPVHVNLPELVDPFVWLGDIPEPKIEAVVVTGVPVDSPSLDVATYGATSSTEETFTLRIIVGTRVTGCDALTARARLRVLCEVVQNALRSPSTGRQQGGFEQLDGRVFAWRVSRYAPQVYALPDGDGFGGFAEIDVTFRARI